MYVSHSGASIDAEKLPVQAALLCVRAAAGCGSKSRAWAWADDAIKCLEFKSLTDAAKLKELLYESSTNFPNTSGGLEFVEQFFTGKEPSLM